MDARMQKHRMTRWLERLLVMLSLVTSCGAQAAASYIEYVDPLPGLVWYAYVPGYWGPYTSADEACLSQFKEMSGLWSGWTITYTGSTPSWYGQGGVLAYVSCHFDATRQTYPYAKIHLDTTILSSMLCPIPSIDPTNLYQFDSRDDSKCHRLAHESLSITLSGGSEVEPSNGSTINTLPFVATVKYQSSGQPPTNPVKVHISLKVDPISGGHDHGKSDRPRGGIATVKTCGSDGECWSNPTNNGAVVFNFNAPEASGKHIITATCDGCSNTATANVDVKVDGLEIIPDSSFYTFIGGGVGKPHRDNHYLMPEASTVLRNMAISYRVEDKFWQLKQARRGKKGTYTPPSVLYVNDASLVWGGKFDIHGKWAGDHRGHRRGIVVDIRANQININNGAIPLQSFDNFQKLAKSYNAKAQVHCGDDGQDRQPPACIGNDGTQDDLRHFHLILLGGVDK